MPACFDISELRLGEKIQKHINQLKKALFHSIYDLNKERSRQTSLQDKITRLETKNQALKCQNSKAIRAVKEISRRLDTINTSGFEMLSRRLLVLERGLKFCQNQLQFKSRRFEQEKQEISQKVKSDRRKYVKLQRKFLKSQKRAASLYVNQFERYSKLGIQVGRHSKRLRDLVLKMKNFGELITMKRKKEKCDRDLYLRYFDLMNREKESKSLMKASPSISEGLRKYQTLKMGHRKQGK